MVENKSDKKKRDPERTRQVLLEAALVTFAEGGFAGSTIEQIADRARVNKALVSYHFGGKQGLYDAVHVQAFALLSPAIAGLPSDDQDAVADLRRFIAGVGGLGEADPHYPVMLLRALIAGETDPTGAVAGRIIDVYRTLASILAKGHRSRVFRPADPLLTQITIFGSLLFFFATAATRKNMAASQQPEGATPPTAEAFLAHQQELVVRGLLSDGRRP